MKLKIILLVAIIILVVFVSVFANQITQFVATVVDFRIFLNDEERNFDLPVVIIDNHTYIPLRELSENFGMGVEWDGENNKIYITQSQAISANKLLVEFISFNSAKNVYVITGPIIQIVGEYISGAPMLELGEIVIFELLPYAIVKTDNFGTSTMKRLYEEYYLSGDNQFLHYPMVFNVEDKSFSNYGN